MFVEVRNVHGSSTALASYHGYQSWKDFWLDKTNYKWPDYCPIVGCSEKATLGAHVYIVGDPYNRVFIMPMCDEHNQDYYGTFKVDSAWLYRLR